MRPIDKGGNPIRNAGLFMLLIHLLFFYTSSIIYMSQGNELWFSRFALASILLGLYLIADKN